MKIQQNAKLSIAPMMDWTDKSKFTNKNKSLINLFAILFAILFAA